MLTTSIVIGLIALLYAFWVDVHSDGDRSPTRAAVALGAGLAIVLAGITLAHAADFTFDEPKSNWSTGDTWREVGFQGLWAIDLLQTHQIVEHPITSVVKNPNGSETINGIHETNYILGQHPSMAAVNRYFIAGAALHAGISYLLPEKYRAPFQYVTIGIEGGYVANNLSLGIGVGF